jgi:uncharacterized protein (UPF0332 family)
MEKLKNKSEFNLEAADLLIKSGLYAPSVHCSYFSCFQLVKVIVCTVIFDSITDHGSKISQTGGHSHKYFWNAIKDTIYSLKGREKERSVSRKYKDLKTFREESDYGDIQIDSSKGIKARVVAAEINNFLKHTFLS